MPIDEWRFKDDAKYLPWPEDGSGDPVEPAFLEEIENQIDLELELSLLRAYSIPTLCRRPGIKWIIGYSKGSTEIYVPETMLDDARNIISVSMSAMDTDAYRAGFDENEKSHDDEYKFDDEEDSDQ